MTEEGIFTEATDVVSLNSVLSFRFCYTVLCMMGMTTGSMRIITRESVMLTRAH